jgi:acyl transferase domain-containing protein/NAD(P)-dependent dehydrogenase (short-subunit alcohol dehydrogenase family)/acyl carrier protein
MSTYRYPEDRIAVVGMGGLFPDAGTIDVFWNNILQKKVSIREVPAERLDQKIYYRPDMLGKPHKDDKTYTKIAAIAEVNNAFDLCRQYRIPPAVAQHMDPNQHAAIYCVDQALRSLRGGLPKERTAVIFGTGGQGKSYDNIIRRTFYPKVQARAEAYLRDNPGMDAGEIERFLQKLAGEALQGTLPVSEDSAPGELQNIIAARISNIFDFWGPSFTVDAACASALAAASIGIVGLQRHEFDVLITGGMEFTLDETGMIIYSGINALSPDGSFPFDERANGFVIGLGGGVLILKRLEDALRDQDHIWALISGYGQGSDGKGKYIAAPSEDGQARVIRKACQAAGYPADTIEYIETHGTGTSVGDTAEVSALKKAFHALGVTRQNFCGLGSVKSNIGHLRYASGAASLIKVSMALHEKVLPPTAGIRKINPKLELEGSPFYILADEKPWREVKAHPRRANVSTYGFGGADYHVALEEYRPEFLQKIYPSAEISAACESAQAMGITPALRPAGNGPQAVFFSGDSWAELKQSFMKLLETPPASDFHTAVFMSNSAVTAQKDWRVAICARSMAELAEKWTLLEEHASGSQPENSLKLQRNGIFSGKGGALSPGQIALMFPGQASQYPNMLKSIFDNYAPAESVAKQIDAIWQALYGYPVTSLIFGDEEAAIEQQLKNTKNTHPAMFVSNMAMHKLLAESGIQAGYMIGHSLGEITALCAGRMLDLKSAVQLVGERGVSLDGIPEPERGIMAAINADSTRVEKIIRSHKLKAAIANINSPEQTVVGGKPDDIDKLAAVLKQNKITHTLLKVSHAFHTRLTQKAADRFHQKIQQVRFGLPKTRIMACQRADFYPDTPEGLQEMPEILRDQITSPVNFLASVQKLYDLGVRVFIETGPSAVLSGLVRSILKDPEVKAIAVNQKKQDALESFQLAVAELFCLGVDIEMVPSNQLLGIHTGNIHGQPEVASHDEAASAPSPAAATKESIVYSGVSFGLPGTFKKVFSDDNFKLLLEGQNLIELLTRDELGQLVDLNITRLVKDEETATFKKLTALNEVIQLAGKFGQLDMLNDYLLDEKLLEEMTLVVCAGVAAGYEALKDAGIPLVREYTKTASGALLPGRLLLPEEMRAGTGIIFANGLFPIEMVIDEVSKYIASKFGGKARNDLADFYEAVIAKVSDPEAKRLLSNWYAMHHSRLFHGGGTRAVYEFNHRFMTLLSSQANNRLAQFTGAAGPNFFLSAACSSTTNAVTVAEDLIRAGHADRMIVIGADSSSTREALPWIGAGFLSIGAASDKADVFEAAVPFDKRRNGMILGAGAVGLMIEKEAGVAKRGMNGICRILGTHAFNTAGHQSKIDSAKYAIELDRFLTKMEREHALDRQNMAGRTVYYSHETYSARKGGCSHTEKMALENAFGPKFRELKVINTKGMTGHPMGASIEEAVAAKILQYQQIPPVANYKEPDPDLAGLNLSQGGAYRFEYVLRMVSGFGGQGNYNLLQKIASGDERIADRKTYQEWLWQITASQTATLKNYGRLLVAEPETVPSGNGSGEIPASGRQPEMSQTAPASGVQAQSQRMPSDPSDSRIADEILNIYAEVTQYPKEMLDPSMELEADLGIDTVKQATILGMISEKFNIPSGERLQLSSYPTIGHIIDLFRGRSPVLKEKQEPAIDNTLAKSGSTGDTDIVFEVISEITQYPVEMLEKDMEMEADLGIDTVKQATIFGILGQKFSIPGERTVNISQYKTIGSVLDFISEQRRNMPGNQPMAVPNPPENLVVRASQPNESQPAPPNIAGWNPANIEKQVLEVISEITQYPVEMLEKDMEMEADLGIDTVKQATIHGILAEKFGHLQDKPANLSQYTTIGAIIHLVQNQLTPDPIQISEAERIRNDAQTGPVTLETAEPDGDSNSIPSFEITGPERDLCLQIPVFTAEKLGPRDFELTGKTIWVIGDHPETVRRLAGYFKKLAGRVAELNVSSYQDASALEDKVAAMAKKPVDVVIDCTHIGKPLVFEEISQNQMEQIFYFNSEARFVFYKKLVEFFPEPEMRIACLISMDGGFGCQANTKPNHQILDPFYGALGGFYKALSKEWPKSRVKVLDLGPLEAAEDLSDNLLSKIADELKSSSPDVEIGYRSGKRLVLKIDVLDQSSLQAISLPDHPHCLVTGGGHGITAEIALRLSKERKCRFTIMGRTVLPDNIAELAGLDAGELEQKKLEIHNALKQKVKKVTPLMVQTEFDKISNAISVYQIIQRIEQDGNEVIYLPCDVSGFAKLKKAMAQAVSKNGPVQILIHGAGIEKSRLISQKPAAEFREIFGAKAVGLCNVYRLLDPKELKALIGFSSISGRFGNEAQADYCAANSFIHSFIAMVRSAHKEIHAVSIAWSGWKDIGMAWRNEFVKTHSEEMGIHLIEPERGTAEFMKILNHRSDAGEIIISKGLHSFISRRMLRGNLHETPLIDWATKNDGKYEAAHKVFSVKRDPIIDQHRLGTTPLLPAVACMEICAEFHSLNFGPKEQYCFRNLELSNPLKLHHEKAREIILTARPGAQPGSFEAVFSAFLDSKFGVSKRIELSQMTVSPTPGDYLPLLSLRELETESMETGYTRQSIDDMRRRIPNAINLGPLFMDGQKENNIYHRNHNGAVYSIAMPEEITANPKYRLADLLINPAFMDSVFQACGVHTNHGNERVYLPWKADELGVVNVPKEHCRYKAYAKVKTRGDGIITYDVIMINERDEVCYYAKNVTMRAISS